MKKDRLILYVEDEDEIRENTWRPLNYLCDTLLLADNGKEGLELYKQHQPDIVISDIRMPEMDGIEMCKAIKTINPEQHIIFTTAHSESSYFMEAIEMQVDGYILKPIDYDLLENKINAILKQIEIKQRLKEQETLTDEIIHLQDNILCVLDNDYRVLFANKQFLTCFGVKNKETFNANMNNMGDFFIKGKGLFYPKNKQGWIKELQQIKDDNKRIVSMASSQGEIKAYIISLKYITETQHAIVILTGITHITREKSHLKQKAYTDELTGIANRAFFEEQFSQEVQKFKKHNIKLSFIIFDIDKFKHFNDTYGHQLGDTILIELAQLVKSKTRQSDTFARWGGEEFVCITPATSLENAVKLAEDLRHIIEQHIFSNGLTITCSFGVTEFGTTDSKLSVMKRADEALYRAKNNGRNKVES